VLAEVAGLAQQGVKEVTLLGQNVNAYRGALGATADVADLALLVEHIADIAGVARIRYTTSHPNEFTQRLIDVYARVPQLVSQVHLPVQHGSDRILAAMKRGYTTLQFKNIVRRLRAVRPGISISSDFIVGFPGETDEDFELTLKLIDDVGFDGSFSFVFSPRPDATQQAVKLDRLRRLQALVDAQASAVSQTRVGTIQKILVEGPARKDRSELTGRTLCNRSVNFKGPARLRGELVDVSISEALAHTLRGQLCDERLAIASA
jgi:tRNA-2-methylthio-N6-dimethylallyladenosine synthase